jgi:hypothetical protein
MGRIFWLAIALIWSSSASGQTLPKVRMAYTSINIQMTPVYIIKDLDLARKQGLDAEVLMIPVSSRAIQAALAGEIQFMTSGGVANINGNISGGDFVGITSTISTFVFEIIGQPGIKEPSHSSRVKGWRYLDWAVPATFPCATHLTVGVWYQTKMWRLFKSAVRPRACWRCRTKLSTRRPSPSPLRR